MNKLALALIGTTLSASAFAAEPATTTVAATTGLMSASTVATVAFTALVPAIALAAVTVIAENNNTVSTVATTK